MKIAFVIKGGKARKAELSPQRRLRISSSAFLYLLSVTETERKHGSCNNQSSSYKRYLQTFAFQVISLFIDEEISKEVIHKEIKEELKAMESPEEEIKSERPAKKIRFLSLLCDEAV